LIPYEEKDRFILFILEIDSLKKIVEGIIEGGGIIMKEGVILKAGVILEGCDDPFNGEVFCIFDGKDDLNGLRYPSISWI
jgi:hypothetical protein